MASGCSAGALQDEVSCTICLEDFKDPVVIECGHSFCRACITQYRVEWEERARGPWHCPVCKAWIQTGNLRPNLQLASLVEKIKQLDFKNAEGGNKNLDINPKLFREGGKDAAISMVSPESQPHASPPVPAQEIEGASQDSQDEEYTFIRTEYLIFRGSEDVPDECMTNVLAKCINMRLIENNYKENVTLDPATANIELIVSEDRMSVRWGDAQQDLPDSPQRFYPDFGVLGSEGFTSGRHYWQVELGDGATSWIVGVIRESVPRKGGVRFYPQNGAWIVEQSGGQYRARGLSYESLPLGGSLRKIGIYLDYEGRQVTFYDAVKRTPITTYIAACFKEEKIFPVFCVWGERSQLRLCS